MSTLALLFAIFLGGPMIGAGLMIMLTGWVPPSFPGPARDLGVMLLAPGLLVALPQVGLLVGGIASPLFLLAAIGCGTWGAWVGLRYRGWPWPRQRQQRQRRQQRQQRQDR